MQNCASPIPFYHLSIITSAQRIQLFCIVTSVAAWFPFPFPKHRRSHNLAEIILRSYLVQLQIRALVGRRSKALLFHKIVSASSQMCICGNVDIMILRPLFNVALFFEANAHLKNRNSNVYAKYLQAPSQFHQTFEENLSRSDSSFSVLDVAINFELVRN